jgi:acetoin utilization protein AcuB
MLAETSVMDWMTSPVVCVRPTLLLRDAHQLMSRIDVHHLPVTERGRLVGIISQADILRIAPSDAATLNIWEVTHMWERLRVEHAMTRNVITISPGASILEAIYLMMQHQINGLPVTENDRVLGILTEADVFKMVIQAMDTARA